jgi:hypothetical protein
MENETAGASTSAAIWSRRQLPVPTVVFDTFWRFAAERQNVYFARLRRMPPPWTSDPVISDFKFTNAYRASDRVSQFLIREVIYQDHAPLAPEDVFFRIMLFKLFNKIETWRRLEEHLGPLTYRRYSFEAYDRVLSRASEDGAAIYSAAYIMPSGNMLGHKRKHRNHLALLEKMMRDNLCVKLARTQTMQAGFELFRSYPTIGDFLAYQYVTDINYSELTDFSETEFVVPGPGAVDGLRKAFSDTCGFSDADVIRWVADTQEDQFERLCLNFQTLFGRNLQYIDCQNLFCEVDKYSRVAHPEYVGRSGRMRIKQRFVTTGMLPDAYFPPKWKIITTLDNDRGPEWT